MTWSISYRIIVTKHRDFYNCYRGTQVAVLGASGFIGRWVARKLCIQGANTCLIVRDRAAVKKILSKYSVDGDIFEVDVRNSDLLFEVFQQIKPSITFNLVSYGVDRSEQDEKIAYQVNAEAVKTICTVVAGIQDPEWTGQDVVHVGSALEYGTIGGNLFEGSIPYPTTLYGRSKLAGTYVLARCCEAHGVKGLTARLFTVYGSGEHTRRLLPSLLEAAKTQKPLHLTAGKQRRDFTYVEDVAEGLLRLGLVEAKPGEIVNLATGKLTSVRSFAEITAKILQIPQDRLKFGTIPTRTEEMEHDEVALDLLRRLTSWVPSTGIVEGIRKTLNFETI